MQSEAKEAGSNHGDVGSGEARSQDAERNSLAAPCKGGESRMAETWRFY